MTIFDALTYERHERIDGQYCANYYQHQRQQCDRVKTNRCPNRLSPPNHIQCQGIPAEQKNNSDDGENDIRVDRLLHLFSKRTRSKRVDFRSNTALESVRVSSTARINRKIELTA